MRKYYSGFTLFKLVGASLILLAHYSKTNTINFLDAWVPHLSIQFAVIVPCFYVVSGFLACKGWRNSKEPLAYVRKYALRLLAVYGAFCVLFLLEDTLPRLLTGRFDVQSLNRLIGNILFLGPYGPLWFIPPLAIGVYLCFQAERAGRLPLLAGLLIAGYLAANLILGALSPFLEWAFGIVANPENTKTYFFQLALFRYLGLSLPYIFAGVWIGKHETLFINIKHLGICAFLAIVLEVFLIRNFAYIKLLLTVSNLLTTLWLFQVLLKAEVRFIQPYHSLIQRFTLLMFLLHIPFLKVFVWWFETPQDNFQLSQFLFCLIGINLLVALLSISWGVLERKAIKSKTQPQ